MYHFVQCPRYFSRTTGEERSGGRRMQGNKRAAKSTGGKKLLEIKALARRFVEQYRAGGSNIEALNGHAHRNFDNYISRRRFRRKNPCCFSADN
jgi:hypothetical protein